MRILALAFIFIGVAEPIVTESFSGIFVASMKKLPIFAEVVGVPLVESGALFILMSP